MLLFVEPVLVLALAEEDVPHELDDETDGSDHENAQGDQFEVKREFRPVALL